MKDYHAQQNLTREALLKNDAFLTDAAIYMGKRTRRTFETEEEAVNFLHRYGLEGLEDTFPHQIKVCCLH